MVIRFDPVRVTSVADFAGFVINGIGPDLGFGQWACEATLPIRE